MGKFVIYDVHEDVPRDILSKFWLPRASRKVLATLTEYYENQAVKKFTSIVAATPLIKERFDSLNMSTLAVMNYPIFEEFNPVPWKERQYEVCYTGVITPSSGIDALIESVSLSRASGVRLNLAGRYSPESYRITLSRKKGWKNVNECGNLGRKDVVNVIRKSKAGIALNIEARSTAALSTKMFEYMAAGVPVIVSDIPTWKDIVDKHRCGICVNPHDSAAIADAIHYLASNEEISVQMGMNGRRAVERCFSWEMEFAKLLQLYNSIHSRNPGLFSKRIPSQIEGSPVASTFRSR
jgi:glycosyltransferase involved in cell wall biosynthesis